MADIAGRPGNSPTLASIAVFGEGAKWLRGRTTHPTRIWRGIEVDEHLTDEWLDELNSLPDIEVRATCEGHRDGDSFRPTYLIFRLLPEQDSKAESVAEVLSKEEGVYSLADIGSEARPRVVIAAKLAYSDPGWQEFWSGMANRIRIALELTVAGHSNPGATKISVRFGELLLPQEFIRPRQVEDLAAELTRGLSEDDAVLACWSYVCRKIKYPDAPPGVAPDRHVLHAFPIVDVPFFGIRYRIVRSQDDFWEYPSETLDWKIANCEGTSILLCSLLRAYGIAPERVWVVVGKIPTGHHAWVELDDIIFETTLSSAPASPLSCTRYAGRWKFNDIMRVGEIVFVPCGDDREKLAWIAQRWGHPTKEVLTLKK